MLSSYIQIEKKFLGSTLKWKFPPQKSSKRDITKFRSYQVRMTNLGERMISKRNNIYKTSQEYVKLLMKKSKLLFQNPAGQRYYAVITIEEHTDIECWICRLYFPKTGRTFATNIHHSDIRALSQQYMDLHLKQFHGEGVQKEESILWDSIMNGVTIVESEKGSMLQLDQQAHQLRELVYHTYLFNETDYSMFFVEMSLGVCKSSGIKKSIYDSFQPLQKEDWKKYEIKMMSFCIKQGFWIKDQYSLFDSVIILQKKHILPKNISILYYSTIKSMALALCYQLSLRKKSNPSKMKIESKIKDKKTHGPRKEKYENIKHIKINKSNEKGLVSLKHLIYEETISINPILVGQIYHFSMKEKFIFSIYRPIDSSIYRRTISYSQVQQTFIIQISNQLLNLDPVSVGERIFKFFISSTLRQALLHFYQNS